jgi:opacity protein-like surface antigen
MGLKDAPTSAEGPRSWTGLYVGAQAGAIWGSQSWRYLSNGAAVSPGYAGWLGGGQVGYNLQMGNWLVGLEGDLHGGNAKGGVSCPNTFFFTCEAKLNSLASLTGRLGIIWNRAVFYAKGGISAGRVRAQTQFNANVPFNNGVPFGIVPPTNGTTKTLVGYTVGGGVEFALTERWSAKAEYMHFDLGSGVFTADPGAGPINVNMDGDLVKIGINVKLF